MTEMESTRAVCFSCGALVPEMAGPTHSYMLSAPGCWHLYGILLSGPWRGSQLVVDVYAVQHPGKPGRRANQSVCVHLLNLCRVLEFGGRVSEGPRFLQTLTHRVFPWLVPPPPPYPITVSNLVAAKDVGVHVGLDQRYAEATWAAWSAHHAMLRKWLNNPRSLPQQAAISLPGADRA